MNVTLRKPTPLDIPVFFEQQNDLDAHQLVGIVSTAPTDREAFNQKWRRILLDDQISKRTILADDEIAGHVTAFLASWSGRREVGYWIGREYWGRGIVTSALSQFLTVEIERPLFATVASHNTGSIRVLEKCGFEAKDSSTFTDKSNGKEITELSFRID